MSKNDLLPECNVVQAPLDVFKEQCCDHCINPECSRSGFGQSKFDVRVGNWHERLFSEVPRMDQGDPRFEGISGQKFLTIGGGPLVVGQADWADVPTLEKRPEPAPVTAAPEPEPPAPAPAPEKPALAPEKPAAKPPEPAPSAPVRPQAPMPQHMVLANAPSQSGKVLQSPTGQPTDSWSGPVGAPSTGGSTDRVVKPGERVKIGGDGS